MEGCHNLDAYTTFKDSNREEPKKQAKEDLHPARDISEKPSGSGFKRYANRANLEQQRGEILAVLGLRRKKENSSSRKVNAIYASKKGTSFMIVPTGRRHML